MPKGPRIVFKDDRDSSVGRGAVLYAGSLREEVICIVRMAALVAPPMVDNTMVVSEGHRDIRDSRDLHEELRAFDLSLNCLDLSRVDGIPGAPDQEKRRDAGLAWAMRIKANLGDEYDFQVHGEGTNLHVHFELDP